MSKLQWVVLCLSSLCIGILLGTDTPFSVPSIGTNYFVVPGLIALYAISFIIGVKVCKLKRESFDTFLLIAFCFLGTVSFLKLEIFNSIRVELNGKVQKFIIGEKIDEKYVSEFKRTHGGRTPSTFELVRNHQGDVEKLYGKGIILDLILVFFVSLIFMLIPGGLLMGNYLESQKYKLF